MTGPEIKGDEQPQLKVVATESCIERFSTQVEDPHLGVADHLVYDANEGKYTNIAHGE